MTYSTDSPWQHPDRPDRPWLWPVNWVAAGERSQRDKPKPLPYRQHRYPDGIRTICVQLPGRAGHVDVMLSGRAAWAYLGRTEDAAHGDQPDRLVELEWQNPPANEDLPVAPVVLLTLPDGAGYVAVAQERLTTLRGQTTTA